MDDLILRYDFYGSDDFHSEEENDYVLFKIEYDSEMVVIEKLYIEVSTLIVACRDHEKI